MLIVEENAGSEEKMNFGMIAPGEIERFVQDEESVIIDLRDRAEFAARHIVGAVNIPYSKWKAYEESREFAKIAAKKKLVLYCERGPTSFAVAGNIWFQANVPDHGWQPAEVQQRHSPSHT